MSRLQAALKRQSSSRAKTNKPPANPKPSARTALAPKAAPKNQPENTTSVGATPLRRRAVPKGGENQPVLPRAKVRQAAMNLAAWSRDTGSNPGAVESLGDEGLVGAMEAMILGAMTPGKAGWSDRLILFRMCGFSWANTGGSKPQREKGGNAELGARLNNALSRQEARFRGGPAAPAARVIDAVVEAAGAELVTPPEPELPELDF